MTFPASCLLFLAFLLPLAAEPLVPSFLPEDCRITGAVEVREGQLVIGEDGKTGMKLEGSFPEENATLTIRCRTGKKDGGLFVGLTNSSKEKIYIRVSPGDRNADFPDSNFVFVWPEASGPNPYARGIYYVRPNPAFYKTANSPEWRASWKETPGASETEFTLELRPDGCGETQIWMNGQLMNVIPTPSAFSNYEITLPPGAMLSSLAFTPPASSTLLTLPLTSGSSRVKNIPAEFTQPVPDVFSKPESGKLDGLPVAGLGRFPEMVVDGLISRIGSRHASDALPEQALFSIPLAVYHQAWVLCAAKPGGENAFTLRVTRYGHSRGDGVADTVVTLPAADSPDTPDARRVGTVTFDRDGKPGQSPLWLIRVPIRNGFIQDVLFDDDKRSRNMGTPRYLDVELMDPLPNVEDALVFPPPMRVTNRVWEPVVERTSSVVVFDIGMEKSPAEMTVRSNTGSFVFHASDKPELGVEVKALQAGSYQIAWDFADVSGNAVESGRKEMKLDEGEGRIVSVPVSQGPGWYAARFRLFDGSGAELLDTRTFFAMLPPDTRKAGFESPFYGWWFGKNHGSNMALDEVGPLLQRLGIRWAELPEEMPESESLKYNLSNPTVPYATEHGGRYLLAYWRGEMTLDEVIKKKEEQIRHHLQLWPKANRMLVFHETGPWGAPYPSELWGESVTVKGQSVEEENSPEALIRKTEGDRKPEQPLTEAEKKEQEQYATWPKRMLYLDALGKMVRREFPGLKMQFGNDGDSLRTMGEIFRRKFPAQMMDTIAVEDLGQVIAPERALVGGVHSAWFLRELARNMGYGDVPVTACTEWIGRMTEPLGHQAQAEWKVRDGLLALAYGFDTISIGGINDSGNRYYFSIWGGGGLNFRYPYMAPKPAYVAVATLTRVLDQAKFQQFIPAGSTVLHLAEFQRGSEWVYAIWTPRGLRKTSLVFDNDTSRRLIDLYGREKEVFGKSLDLEASTAVQYLVSPSRIVSASAGTSSFPDDAPPAEPLQVIPLESTREVAIVPNPRLEKASIGRPHFMPQLKEGHFDIREVDDPEMGPCLEITLKPEGVLWAMRHEYVVLNLKTPVPTTAKNAGAWVKGNGSWGNVSLTTTATIDTLTPRITWPGLCAMNFDGWNFVRFLQDNPKKPLKGDVTGLMITFPRQVLFGTEMVPVENLSVRVKNILLY